MTIWLLAILLLASLAGLGYRQGAIRVACSFFGILAGAWLAVPLGRLVRPLFVALGLKDPIFAWVIPPLVMFIVISILFKAGAAVLHQKVDVYYKYRAGDLRLALWERLNQRLGLCVGLLNGLAYLIIISFIIYAFSYWTVQLSTGDEDPRSVRILNRLGKDLQATGLNRVARAVDGMPDRFYEAADVAGLLFYNSLLEARLSSYPAFLGLAERGDFQALGKDRDFLEMRQRGASLGKLMEHSPVQAIVKNPETLRLVWNTVAPNLKDLQIYLETGKSPKYDPETLLGRWEFNVNMAMAGIRRTRPNISATEMQKLKKYMLAAFSQTSFVAMTDQTAILKNVPQVKMPAGGPVTPPTIQTFSLEWKRLGNNRYELTFAGGGRGSLAATIEGDRLTVSGEGMELVFTRAI
jgi:uncharacterized membrane protein required for colicin V production